MSDCSYKIRSMVKKKKDFQLARGRIEKKEADGELASGQN